MKKTNVRQMTMTAVLAALAFAAVALIRIPVVMFLSYEPKDVVITIGGFLFGPLTAFVISVLVSFVEMITISSTGWIGLIMNILSTCCFSCLAAYIYKKKKTLTGAVTGLLSGCVLMTAAMLLWNYLITPLYMGSPREAVAAMLLPVFLPFNLIKGGINGVLILLLYKPLVTALRRAHVLETPEGETQTKVHAGVILVSLALLSTLILGALALAGVI